MTRLGRAAAAIAGFALCGVAGLRAQAPQPSTQPTFRTEVSLVEVSAVVTGEDGRSLGELSAADFEVFEDDVARRLVSVRRLTAEAGNLSKRLEHVGSAPPVERLATSTTAADAPAFVLLLDDLDTSRRDAHRVIRAAEQAFTALPETALVSVLTTSGLGGTLLTLEPPGPRHLERIRAFRGQLLVRALTPGGVSSTGSGAPITDGMSGTASLDTADPTRAARRASAVAATAEILGRAGARRKVLLWVTQTMGVSPEDPHGSRAAQRRALTAALDNDVTVFVVDPRGNTGGVEDPDEKRSGGTLRVGGSTMPLEVDDQVAVPLTQLARETGGRYITMANDYGAIMGRIIEQSSTAYLLVYESLVSRIPGRHRIDVRVTRPGVRVSARRAFIVEPPAAGAAPSTDDDSLLRRTLLGSAPHGRLRLTVQAVPRFANGRSGAVSVTVLAEAGQGGLTTPLDVVLATFDDEGRATNQHQVRLDPPPAGGPLEFTTELPLSRGRHQLRVAAVTGDATETGLVITPLEIVEPGRQLVMAPPLVLQHVGAQVGPTAARRFVSGVSLGVQAEVAGRPVKEGRVAVRLTLSNARGVVVSTSQATLDAAGSPDRRRATGLVDTAGLDAGDYLLTVEATTSGSERGVGHAIPVRLDGSPLVTATSSALRHSVVAQGPASQHAAPGTFVIADEQAWREFWRHLPTRQAAPDIDFSRVTLFAVVGSGDDGAPARPVVVSVTEQGGTTVITWRAEHASATLRQPFTVVAVPQRVTDVRFERAPAM